MVRVGLTGGIACGKTTIGVMFVELGAYLTLADQIAHELMEPGQAVYREVVQHFGPAILGPDGNIDRAKLAEAAFGTGRIQELNAIVHPAVIARQEEFMDEVGRRDPRAVAIVEAALIFEAGVASHFDRIVVVTCAPEQRVERFASRHHLAREVALAEVERRMAAQWPEEKKVAAADYVIDNSGTLEQAFEQATRVYAELKTAGH